MEEPPKLLSMFYEDFYVKAFVYPTIIVSSGLGTMLVIINRFKKQTNKHGTIFQDIFHMSGEGRQQISKLTKKFIAVNHYTDNKGD